jgi:G3E family GTPase
MSSQIPVTVLTGYLGAGKTTLLNRILSEPHGQKYAVIVNEFGEIGIDNDLVVGADEEVFEMNNGCVCCTVRGDLIRIISGLLKRKGRFDGIIVETTGLADPAPVAQTFFVDEDVKMKTKLDAVVTVVDAKHLPLRLADSKEAAEQIGFADVILLNKVDLVSPPELRQVEAAIRQINPSARIVRTTRSAAPLDAVLNLGAFDLERIIEREPEFLKGDAHDHQHHHHDHGPECAAHGCEDDHVHHGHDHHAHDHDHHHHDHGEACAAHGCDDDRAHGELSAIHDSGVGSISLASDRLLDERRFMGWYQTLLNQLGQDILRSKGILAFEGETKRYVLQAVHMMAEGDFQREWREDEPRRSRLVLIGRNLDRDALTKDFEACLV